jgi:steroid delta-isomerase-like uncharacterized protein
VTLSKLLLAVSVLGACAPANAPPCAAAPVIERNKEVAARVFSEILGAGHFELAATLYAPSFVNHASAAGVGLAEDQAAAKALRAMYPDATIHVLRMVGEGEFVSVLWHAAGTHTGAIEGVPATGKKVDASGITIWRLVDGRITDEWSQFPDPTTIEK